MEENIQTELDGLWIKSHFDDVHGSKGLVMLIDTEGSSQMAFRKILIPKLNSEYYAVVTPDFSSLHAAGMTDAETASHLFPALISRFAEWCMINLKPELPLAVVCAGNSMVTTIRAFEDSHLPGSLVVLPGWKSNCDPKRLLCGTLLIAARNDSSALGRSVALLRQLPANSELEIIPFYDSVTTVNDMQMVAPYISGWLNTTLLHAGGILD